MNYKTFYINLDRSHDRREKMEKQFYIHNIKASRFSAIDGKLLDKEFLRSTTTPKSFYYLDLNNRKRLTHEDINSTGHYAVFLSHITLWKKLLEDNEADFYLIFEDDVILNNLFIHKFNNIVKNNHKFDFISLIYISKRMNNMYNKYNGMYLIRHPFFGMQSYVISKNGAKRLLNYVDKIDCHIDAYVGYVSFYDNLNSLMVHNDYMLGTSSDDTSTINHKNCLFCKEDYGEKLIIPTNFRLRHIYNKYNIDLDYSSIFLILILLYFIMIINIKK